MKSFHKKYNIMKFFSVPENARDQTEALERFTAEFSQR